MFYRDLILTVQPGDVQFFMNQLLTLVHEKHHRLPVAIALPQFEPAQPNRTDTYDNPRHARMGKVLRLFHPVAYVLDAAIDLLGIQELVDKHVLFVTPGGRDFEDHPEIRQAGQCALRRSGPDRRCGQADGG